jgi:hypothetical protein
MNDRLARVSARSKAPAAHPAVVSPDRRPKPECIQRGNNLYPLWLVCYNLPPHCADENSKERNGVGNHLLLQSRSIQAPTPEL